MRKGLSRHRTGFGYPHCMPKTSIDRRALLASGVATATALVAGGPAVAAPAPLPNRWQNGRSPWPLCLDTATIRPTPLLDKIAIAAKAGFDAIEPWDGELRDFESNGGSLSDLGTRIKDAGLFVPSVIGLWNAIPPTEEEWLANLSETRNRMRMASAIGAEFVQVIPQPRRPWQEFDLKWAATKYRALLEMGLADYNLNPAMVFVEFLPGAARMGQAAAIALDADHPKAKIIPDVFHMHIGDSGFSGLRLIQGEFIAIFQFNDAPAHPAKEQLKDEHRVFPGDGILPLEQCLKDLRAIGYTRCISLELYNQAYWERDALEVATEGHDKTLKVIEASLG
jgi:2-keto-myo-inositol isomerase